METKISVIVPIFNEEETLHLFFDRLSSSMKSINYTYEVIFVNDGSCDNSLNILNTFLENNSQDNNISIINLDKNYGKQTAIIAGFTKAKGQIVITIEASLQSPPEEISNLVQKIEEENEYVCTFSKESSKCFLKKYFSKATKYVLCKLTNTFIENTNNIFCAYSKNLVDKIVLFNKENQFLFLPYLALELAEKKAQIEFSPCQRASGVSKYRLLKSMKSNFDFICSSSILPVQIITILGFVLSLISAFCIILILLKGLIFSEIQTVSVLFLILFFLICVCILSLGIIGQYVSRSYLLSQKKPSFKIKSVFKK